MSAPCSPAADPQWLRLEKMELYEASEEASESDSAAARRCRRGGGKGSSRGQRWLSADLAPTRDSQPGQQEGSSYGQRSGSGSCGGRGSLDLTTELGRGKGASCAGADARLAGLTHLFETELRETSLRSRGFRSYRSSSATISTTTSSSGGSSSSHGSSSRGQLSRKDAWSNSLPRSADSNRVSIRGGSCRVSDDEDYHFDIATGSGQCPYIIIMPEEDGYDSWDTDPALTPTASDADVGIFVRTVGQPKSLRAGARSKGGKRRGHHRMKSEENLLSLGTTVDHHLDKNRAKSEEIDRQIATPLCSIVADEAEPLSTLTDSPATTFCSSEESTVQDDRDNVEGGAMSVSEEETTSFGRLAIVYNNRSSGNSGQKAPGKRAEECSNDNQGLPTGSRKLLRQPGHLSFNGNDRLLRLAILNSLRVRSLAETL